MWGVPNDLPALVALALFASLLSKSVTSFRFCFIIGVLFCSLRCAVYFSRVFVLLFWPVALCLVSELWASFARVCYLVDLLSFLFCFEVSSLLRVHWFEFLSGEALLSFIDFVFEVGCCVSLSVWLRSLVTVGSRCSKCCLLLRFWLLSRLSRWLPSGFEELSSRFSVFES